MHSFSDNGGNRQCLSEDIRRQRFVFPLPCPLFQHAAPRRVRKASGLCLAPPGSSLFPAFPPYYFSSLFFSYGFILSHNVLFVKTTVRFPTEPLCLRRDAPGAPGRPLHQIHRPVQSDTIRLLPVSQMPESFRQIHPHGHGRLPPHQAPVH